MEKEYKVGFNMEISGEIKQNTTGGTVRTQDTAREAATVEDTTAVATGQSAAPEGTVTPTERLSEILQSYGYKVTDKNLAMLTLMLENALPLTQENVALMNRALKLTDSTEQALFLLQNNMRLTRANAAQLDGLVTGRIRITEQLSDLLAALSEIPDPALRETLTRLFTTLSDNTTPTATPAVPGNNPFPAAAQPPAPPTATDQQAEAQPAGTPPTGTSPTQQQPTTTPAGTPFLQQSQQPAVPLTETSPQAQPAAGETATTPSAPTEPGQRASVTPGETPMPDETALPTQTLIHDGEAARQVKQNPPPRTDNVTTEAEQSAGQITDKARLLRGEPPETHAANTTSRASAPAQRPSFKLAGSTPGDIDRFINTLRDTLTEARQLLTNARADTPETARALREIGQLSEHIDFVAQIKNQLFVQLPVFHNGQETNTALHVYKDASGKQAHGETQSALIALDTASMGRFETYVQKHGHAVTCQFRLRDEAIEKLVRTHIHELDALLSAAHYSLEAFHFLPPGEPYTVLDTPDSLSTDEANPAGNTKRTFVFDRRI